MTTVNNTLLRRSSRALLLLATIIWGSTFFIMKNTLDDVPPLFLLAVRFSIAAILFAPLLWVRRRGITRRALMGGALAGALLFLGYVLQTYGLMGTTPGKNAFLTASYCVATPFLYWLIDRRRPDRYNIAAIILCVTGIGLISLSGDLTISWGDWLTLAGGIFFAGYIVAVAHYGQDGDAFVLTALQFIAAGILSWIGSLVLEDFPGNLSGGAVGSLLYLAIMATAVAVCLQNVGQKHTPPAAASVLLTLEAVFGIFFSMLFYGERPTVRMSIGFAVVFLAVVCSETKFSFVGEWIGRFAKKGIDNGK